MMGRQPVVFNIPQRAAMDEEKEPGAAREPAEGVVPRALPPAAQRALAEAQARRAEYDARAAEAPAERGGRKGPDPARYGDWEVKGIASDF
jgi:hypothetical protein